MKDEPDDMKIYRKVIEARAKAKYEQDSPEISITGWSLNTIDELKEAFDAIIKNAINEAMKIAADEYAVYVYLSDDDGNNLKPGCLRFELPVGAYEGPGEGPVWIVDLNEAFEMEMDINSVPSNAPMDERYLNPDDDSRVFFAQWRDWLRSKADKIDELLTRPKI